ncbi:MAG: hypothetical protein ACPL3C_07240, partial [Pyrobaculum sp.]
MDYLPLVYTAGAVVVLATVAYRIYRREELTRLNILGAVLPAIILLTYASLYATWYLPGVKKLESDLAALKAGQEHILNALAQTAAHASFTVSVITTAANILLPGAGSIIAWIVANSIVDAVEELMSAAAYYLGLLYGAVSVLSAAVTAAQWFAPIFAPLGAVAIKNYRVQAVSAYAAAVPLLLLIAVQLAPPLEPPQITVVERHPALLEGVLNYTANAPVVAVFTRPYTYYEAYGYNKTVNTTMTVFYTLHPPNGTLTLPNGTYSAYVIWGFVNFSKGVITVNPSRPYALNATSQYNRTAYITALAANGIFDASIPYKWVYEWTIAASEPPKEYGITAAKWIVEYSCYGYASDCPPLSKTIRMLGQITNVRYEIVEQEYADVSVSVNVYTPPNVVEREAWERLCAASVSTAVLKRLGVPAAAGCPNYRTPKAAEVSVVIRPTPKYVQIGNTTVEVQTEHKAKVVVIAEYVYTPAPIIYGVVIGNRSLAQTVEAIALLPFGLGLDYLYKTTLEPLLWIPTKALPWLAALVYSIVTVLGGVAGVLLVAGVGAPLLRFLGLELMARAQFRGSALTGLPWALARRAALGAGASQAAGAQQAVNEPVREAVRQVVPSVQQGARMWLLYLASVARAGEMLWRFDPIRLAAVAGGQAYVYKWLRDHTLMGRLEAWAKAWHYVMTPSGVPAAEAVNRALYYAWAATHLRVDVFAAALGRHLYNVYREVYDLTGSRLLAALWTGFYGRAPQLNAEVALFAMAVGVRPERYFPFDVEWASREILKTPELARQLGITKAEEAERVLVEKWLSWFGYSGADII